MNLMMKATVGAKQTPLNVGVDYANKAHASQLLFQTAGNYGMTFNGSYRIGDWATFAYNKSWKSATNPMNQVGWNCAFVAKANDNI